MMGACFLPLMWASGTLLCADLSVGTHWVAPAGDLVCSHS